jgi:hypothetical protein
VAERKILLDAILIGRMHRGGAAQIAAAFRVFGLGQMPFSGARAHDLSAGRDFEPLVHGFFRFNTFWASHKIIQLSFKKSAQYTDATCVTQGIIFPIVS